MSVNIAEGYIKYVRTYQEEFDQLRKSQFWEDVKGYIIRYLHSSPNFRQTFIPLLGSLYSFK
jgi:hypothetical protein